MVEPVIRTGFNYARSDLRHPDSYVAKLKRDSIVWWYGNFRTPKGGSAIPRAELTFRTLYNDVPGPFVSAVVPLSSLPHYQVVPYGEKANAYRTLSRRLESSKSISLLEAGL